MTPFVVYSDFEALFISIGQDLNTRWDRSFDAVTVTACSMGYYIVSTFPEFPKGYKSQIVEGCAKWLLAGLRDWEKEAMGFYYEQNSLQMELWLAYKDNQDTVTSATKSSKLLRQIRSPIKTKSPGIIAALRINGATSSSALAKSTSSSTTSGGLTQTSSLWRSRTSKWRKSW